MCVCVCVCVCMSVSVWVGVSVCGCVGVGVSGCSETCTLIQVVLKSDMVQSHLLCADMTQLTFLMENTSLYWDD